MWKFWRNWMLSTHPLKNLNACGDGGFLTTNNKLLYQSKKNEIMGWRIEI